MKTTAGIAVLMMSLGVAWAQEPQTGDERPKITVSGEAVVNVKPDKIVITLGIETSDTDILAAKQKNNVILKKTIASLAESGVQEKDLQTDHLSIEPRYRDSYRKEDFIGYFVRNTLVVTLTDVAKVEEVVTRVLQAGVNYIHGIDFQTSELRKHRDEARDLALRAAREKAEKMAGVLGRSLGPVLQIAENANPWWYNSSWSAWGYGRNQGMSQNVIQDVQGGPVGAGEGETVALGKISIRASVSVVFAL
jgi:uncharacterized protein